MDLAVTAEARHSEDSLRAAPVDEATRADHQEEENKFQKAIAAWRDIDLTALVPTLDAAAQDLVTHQRDALVQRKDLAQKTKDFRKLDDAGKLTEFKSLLKAYQTFIDLITNQSKSTSSAFLSIYTPLSEAPDPYPLLDASIDSLITASDTVPRLNDENAQLQRSVNRLTNQLEETEKKLEIEREARQNLESERSSKVEEVETRWKEVLKEKQDNWESKERSLEEKIGSQDRLLKELKASYEVSQRLDKTDDTEASGGATAVELEFVSSELERANSRLAEVEARNESLRLELAQAASQSGRRNEKAVEDDPAFLRLQSENATLLRKLDASRFEKESAGRSLQSTVKTLERELSSIKSEKDMLKDKVSKWGDYEDVKRELEMLKSIEFAMGDEEDGDADEDDLVQSNGSAKTKGETLEQLLLARNKKLSNELTVLRVSHRDLQARLETLQEDLSSTNMELEKSRNLAATLEDDLLKVQQEAANAFPSSAMSVAGTYVSRYPQTLRSGRPGRSSPTSSIISGFEGAGSPMGESVGGGSGILPMITAQRDRFKKKNKELEEELSKQYATVSSLRSEVASLQKDNLTLYEKTRYVSTYRHNAPTSSSSSTFTANNPNPSSIAMGSQAEDKWRSAYESHISPFAAFRGRESQRAFKRMNVFERAVFQITRLVLSTRTSRNLFAAYCLGLHMLVLLMLYWMSSGTSSTAISDIGAVGGAAAGVIGGPKGSTEKANGDWKEAGFQE